MNESCLTRDYLDAKLNGLKGDLTWRMITTALASLAVALSVAFWGWGDLKADLRALSARIDQHHP
jgi:hypothetical protein